MRKTDVWLLLDSSRGGGIETHVRVLARSLLDQHFTVQVVFLQYHGPHPLHAQLDQAGIPWVSLRGGLRHLITALKSTRPALLHTHGYKAGILGRIAARLLGIATVHTYHAGEPGNGRVRLWHALDRATGGLCDERIAVSKPIAQQIGAGVHLVPNFIALPTTRQHRTFKRSVAFVGRLSPEKGPEIFCQIAAFFSGALDFHVYGEGPMLNELLRRYGHCVHFHGYVNGMSGVWNTTDALLITSHHEGLPLVALEAMAHGVPVISSRVGALPDIIEHETSGWLFEAGDTRDAISAVHNWLFTPYHKTQTMLTSARATIERRFSADAVIERIVAVYRAAVAHRARVRGTHYVSSNAAPL